MTGLCKKVKQRTSIPCYYFIYLCSQRLHYWESSYTQALGGHFQEASFCEVLYLFMYGRLYSLNMKDVKIR